MREVAASFSIEDAIDGEAVLLKIEKAGRTAYKSEHHIGPGSAASFVRKLIERQHLSVLEHVSITVRVTCDRGISHEIVRHRIASYTQESTRFCNYADEKFGSEIAVIRPSFWKPDDSRDKAKYDVWARAMADAEIAYIKLLDAGASPEEARSVLPNSLKTELVITMNLREWRHFFHLRTAATAHPQMRDIAKAMLMEFRRQIPLIFDDVGDAC